MSKNKKLVDAKILLVDDHFRAVLREMLKEIGFQEILEAKNTEEAMSLLQGNEIDLIVSDYVMKPISGMDFLRTLKANQKLQSIPFIMVSGSSEPGVEQEAFNFGAIGFVSKPVSFDELKEAVERAFE